MPAASQDRFQSVRSSRTKRWLIRLVAAVLVLGVVYEAFMAFVAIRTNVLWYDSLDAGSVYGKILGAEIVLFCVFGIVTALAVWFTLMLVVRYRPRFRPDPQRQKWRRRFLRLPNRYRVWLAVAVAVYLGIQAGSRAAGRWQLFMMWRHKASFGVTDPQFHRDVSYFVSVLPFQQAMVGFLTRIVVTCLVLTLVAGFLYGALKFRGAGRKVSPALKAQLSVLLGLYLLLKAASYWLARYALTTSHTGPVTGLSYTDEHAKLPALTILTLLAVLFALLLFANAWLRRLRWIAVGLGGMVVAALLVGTVWPTLVYRFREQPSASTLDRASIERNQAATGTAFGLDHDLTRQEYGQPPASDGFANRPPTSVARARRNAQIRLLDPAKLSPTFNNKQEIQAFYQFKSPLDVSSYDIGGHDQDVAIAARELNLSGIPRGSWSNNHLIYTHGYGVVAAPTDEMDSGTPNFINANLPPTNQLIPVKNPQIYFGQYSPAYSIVGQPAGSTENIEFDHPNTNGGSTGVHNTYRGDGGVPIGSRFNRLLYAVKLRDPNIFFSSSINSASQLLTVRNPRTRVAKVAPWLTLDGDVYPAVVDGQVDWVVDGYTSTANYPDAQRLNLHNATSNSLTNSSGIVSQPNRQVNYLKNSVKAVVNAYTGKVTLYSWNQQNQPDPILQTWENVFPGLVRPESSIPAPLLPHLRYPQDLFNVQRSLLAQYHVTDPGDFYNGADFWKVPTDPTVAAAKTFNGLATGKGSSPTLPSTYMSISPTGDGQQRWAISSPMVTLNYRQLAGFLAVNAQPGPDYGKFTMLDFPAGQSFESPAQIQNDIESDQQIASHLTLLKGNSTVVLGNLLTIPLDNNVLYVEPVYTQARGSNTFPILRKVIAVFGNGQPAFEDTLDQALHVAIKNASAHPRG